MALREPPRTAPPPPRVPWPALVGVQIALAVGLAGLILWARPAPVATSDAAVERQIASKLKAAGAMDEAALVYESFLGRPGTAPDVRASVAFSLGEAYLERGSYERALRWYYEAEATGSAPGEVGARIVHCLEALGRVHEARAALASRSALDAPERADSDPVVARIGTDAIHASDVLRALDDLPPHVSASVGDAAGREAFLRKYVADELLWRKAQALELDSDPAVRRRHAAALRQLALDAFLEREVVAKIDVGEAELETWFQANAERYRTTGEDGAEGPDPVLAELRPRVERDYRMWKIQTGYEELVAAELASSQVELLPDALEAAR